MFCSYYRTKQKDTPIPDTAAKGVDMPHMNRPYKSSCRCHRYCRIPRKALPFPCAPIDRLPLMRRTALRALIISFLRCRFGKETGAGQYRPA